MKRKILIVDDEVEIINSVKVLLQEKDRDIYAASDGVKALEIIKKEEIDCIVSDIYMPNMDGMMLIQEIRKLNGKVPVIFFTGFGNEKLLNVALSYGAYDFIEKPKLDDLCGVVEKCLVDLGNKDNAVLDDLDGMLDED